jgi:hypothetical protein
MKTEQKKWTQLDNWQTPFSSLGGLKPQLVLVFGDRSLLSDPKRFEELKQFYPDAHIAMASTAGNVLGANLFDQSIIATAIAFEQGTQVRLQKINIVDEKNSTSAGEKLAKSLQLDGLKHLFILSDGHLVNGSELIKGVLSVLPSTVGLTGGLAGDGTLFQKTVVGLDAPPKEGEIIAICFYGPHVKFGIGSFGGWDSFGVERTITRSKGNILYELDGKSALDLYKQYLGEQAEKLPGSALLFPLSIRQNEQSAPLVRTILSIDEKDKGMIFAGDVPEGWRAQLMKANFDRLVNGAEQAALASYEMIGSDSPDLAILISCVGRRIVLDQRIEEEIECVREVIGENTTIAGFYSYGEIAPKTGFMGCELHNQTMTITTISER